MPYRRTRFVLSCAALLAARSALAETDTYIGPASGDWSDPTNWSLGIVPNDQPTRRFDVVIAPVSRSTVSLLVPSTVNSLTLGANNVMDVSGSLSFDGYSLANDGTLSLQGAASAFLKQDLLLSGGGVLLLDGSANLVSGAAGRTLTNSSTIRGGGTLGTTSLMNLGTITASSGVLALTPLPSGATSSGMINGALLRADGGILDLTGAGTLTNTSGTIEALANSVVSVNSALVDGVLRALPGGTVTFGSATTLQNVSFAGYGTASGGTLTIASSLANTGTIDLAGGTLKSAADLRLTGGGTLLLGSVGSTALAAGKRLTTDNVISGAGTLGTGMVLSNSGTITATGLLTLGLGNGNSFNTGTLCARGGTLALTGSGTLTNTGGTVAAFDNSLVSLSGTITGGSFQTSGTGTVTLASAHVQHGTFAGNISGSTCWLYGNSANAGTLFLAGTAYVQDVLRNTGTICTGPGGLSLSGNLLLSGGGTLLLSGKAPIFGVFYQLTTDNLITGQGSINPDSLVNNGTISATNGLLDVSLSSTKASTNAGVLRADGGTLSISSSGTLTNSSGIIEALDNSSVLLSGYGTITGGLLRTSGTGSITLSRRAQDVTLSGTISIDGGTLAGSCLNSQVLTFGSSAATSGYLSGTLTNAGIVNVSGSLSLAADSTLTGGGTVNLAAGICSGTWRLSSDNFIVGRGAITCPLSNSGTVIASGGTLYATVSANSGILRADGGTLDLTGGYSSPLTNAGGIIEALANSRVNRSSGDIRGGIIQTFDSGTVTLYSGTLQDVTLSGNISLSGTTLTGNCSIFGSPYISSTIRLLNLANAGLIALRPSSKFTISDSFTLSGGGTLSLAGTSFTGNGRLITDNLIVGTGSANSVFLTNNGAIVASGGSLTLTLPVSTGTNINAGTLRADNGTLTLRSFSFTTTLDNTLGIIEARDASIVTISYPIIFGGTVRSVGSGIVNLDSATLSGVQLDGNIISTNSSSITGNSRNNGAISNTGGTLSLTGSLLNSGTLLLGGPGAVSRADLVLSGGGSVVLTGPSVGWTDSNYGSRLTTNNYISGCGSLTMQITNSGTIAATTGVLLLDGGYSLHYNTGALLANGGTLSLSMSSGTLTNTGGTIQANDNSLVTFAGTLIGGTLRTVGSGNILISGAYPQLQNVTLAGNALIPSTTLAQLLTSFNNSGNLTVNGTVYLYADLLLSGSGTVVLNGGTLTGTGVVGSMAVHLTSFNTITGIGNLQSCQLRNYGTIISPPSGTLQVWPAVGSHLVSTGSIIADGGTLILRRLGYFDISGSLRALHGGTLSLESESVISCPIELSDGNVILSGKTQATTIVGPGAVTVTSALLSDVVNVSSLSVTGTHTLRPAGPGTGGTSSVGSLTLAGSTGAWTGTLEIADNAFILQPDALSKPAALAAAQDQVAFGLANPAGITSGTTAADPAHKTTVLVDNALLGLTQFGGQPLDANSLLLESTWKGDSNLDRKVDVIDLGALAANYGQATSSGVLQGDYNGDGKIDVIDLGILATNFGLGTDGGAAGDFALQQDLATFPPLSPQSSALSTSSSVPEPASLALLALPFLLLRRPRRVTS